MKLKSKLFVSIKLLCKPDMVAGHRVLRAPDARVLPRCEDPKSLPRLSKLQQEVFRKVAEEYGYLYPYIPAHLEEEIQAK